MFKTKILNLFVCNVFVFMFSSCSSSFWEGLATGMSGLGYYPTYSAGGNNMNYLLDPSYAMAQTIQQQQQVNNFFVETTTATMKQVKREEEEYINNWILNFKNNYGRNPTEQEINDARSQYYQIKNNSYEGNRFSRKTTSTTTSRDKDCPLCNGMKKCITCFGEKIYLNPLTNKYIDCPNCTDGWCSRCHGSGKK